MQELLARLAALVAQAPITGDPLEDDPTTAALRHVVGATMRLVCRLPPAEQAELLGRVCQIPLDAVRAAQEPLDVPRVASALRLLCAAFTDFGQATMLVDSSRAVFLRLVEAHWPLLHGLTAAPAAHHGPVAAALSDALAAAVASAGSDRGALLVHVAPTLGALFTATRHHAPLGALADAAERSGGAGADAAAAAPLYAAIGAAVKTVSGAVAAPPHPPPELLQAALALLSRCAIFHPWYVLRADELRGAVDLATHGMRQAERPVVQDAVALMVHLLAPAPVQQRMIKERHVDTEPLQALVTAALPSLVPAILECMCSSCPPESWRSAGRLVYQLLSTYGAPAAAALQDALRGGALRALATTPLSAADCASVLDVLQANPQLPERRFVAMMDDFAGIAHGVRSHDDLLVYALPPRRITVEVDVC